MTNSQDSFATWLQKQIDSWEEDVAWALEDMEALSLQAASRTSIKQQVNAIGDKIQRYKFVLKEEQDGTE